MQRYENTRRAGASHSWSIRHWSARTPSAHQSTTVTCLSDDATTQAKAISCVGFFSFYYDLIGRNVRKRTLILPSPLPPCMLEAARRSVSPANPGRIGIKVRRCVDTRQKLSQGTPLRKVNSSIGHYLYRNLLRAYGCALGSVRKYLRSNRAQARGDAAQRCRIERLTAVKQMSTATLRHA